MRNPLITSAVVVLACAGTIAVTPTQAQAATTLESRALSIAKSKNGDPYQYGAAGPYRFDCSGLTSYAFAHAGKTIPRTADEQWTTRTIHHVYAKDRRPGDLVYFHYRSGYVYHVGIYAGGGYVWHAPHTGTTVREERIWTSMVWYGRP